MKLDCFHRYSSYKQLLSDVQFLPLLLLTKFSAIHELISCLLVGVAINFVRALLPDPCPLTFQLLPTPMVHL